MKKPMIFLVMALAVLALMISGCTLGAPGKESTTAGAAAESPESAELTSDLNDLEDLDALANEDLDLKEFDNLNLE